MRLAYVASCQLPSRFANTIQVVNMCSALSAAGWDVTLFLPGPVPSENALQEALDAYGVARTFEVRSLRVYDPVERARGLLTAVATPPALRSWWRPSDGLSVLYTRLPWIGVTVSYPGVFYESHFLPDTPYAVAWTLAAWCVRASVRRGVTKAVFAISEGLAARWRARGIPGDRIHVLHDGVQVERFGQADRDTARKALGLPSEQAIAVYAGQMFPDRGPATILEAAALAPDVRFLLVGGLDRDVSLQRRATAERDLCNVQLVGHVAHRDVPMYLAAADVLLIPYSSRWRYASVASPLKVFECLAAGRPVVASAVPAVSQIIDDGRTGLLVPPDNPRALVGAMRSVLSDRRLAVRLASAARHEAVKHTWLARGAAATAMIHAHCASGAASKSSSEGVRGS
jgi:glycosyltransferase involved in cell wall biosynthesis